jgi:hypothetical protein
MIPHAVTSRVKNVAAGTVVARARPGEVGERYMMIIENSS